MVKINKDNIYKLWDIEKKPNYDPIVSKGKKEISKKWQCKKTKKEKLILYSLTKQK